MGTAIELLAAMPSIVYGMWGLLVFGPILSTYVQQPLQSTVWRRAHLGTLFSGPPVGIGVLSAGIILAIMIIPFIASVMRDVFEVTPPMLKEAAYGWARRPGKWCGGRAALHQGGCDRRHHAGLGRALGETMAVTFVIGNFNQLNSLSCSRPPTASRIHLPTSLPKPKARAAPASLIYLGLVLFFITFCVLALSKLCLSADASAKGRQHDAVAESILSLSGRRWRCTSASASTPSR
jgi:phosphate transport system permease protein